MKKLTLLLILTVITQITIISQGCLPNGITFSTQAEIDNFQTNHPDCTEIEGDVIISGIDIYDLSGLEVLIKINGHLNINHCDLLETLNGLSNLNSIGKSLSIDQNTSLLSLSGIESIDSIGNHLFITNNNSLLRLTGLDELTVILNSLIISNNESLIDLLGINNLSVLKYGLHISSNNSLTTINHIGVLSEIGGDLDIIGNDSLVSLAGLENIHTVGGDLSIWETDKLANLSGLENLSSIGGDIILMGNSNLSNLSALLNLNSIGGIVYIFENSMLTALYGLDNIAPTSISELIIFSNPNLSTCEIKSICDYISNPNSEINITNNSTGCDSEEEIQIACETLDVNSLNQEPDIVLYPNPAKMYISISNKKGSTIDDVYLYNHLGQLVLQKSGMTHRIDISRLNQGIYLVAIKMDNHIIRKKILIKK